MNKFLYKAGCSQRNIERHDDYLTNISILMIMPILVLCFHNQPQTMCMCIIIANAVPKSLL